MNFGEALAALKLDEKVARAGWNGKGMWLWLVQADAWGAVGVHQFTNLPWIGMKTADDKFVPWLASQTDLLAEDWEVVS